MRSHRVLLSAGLWVLAVIAVAGLAWFAIDSAGRQVTAAPLTSNDGPAGSPTPDSVGVAAGGHSGDPATPGSRSVPDPGATAGATTAPTPGGSAATTGSSTGPTGSAPATGTPSTTKHAGTTTAAPTAATGTRSTSGGWVSVTCTGTSLTYQASPHPGWTVKAEKPSPSSLEVRFHSKGTRVDVDADCASGTPEFSVREREDSNGRSGSGGDD